MSSSENGTTPNNKPPPPLDTSAVSNASTSNSQHVDAAIVAEAFAKVDPTGSDTVNLTEFHSLLTALDITMEKQMADNFFATMDSNKLGRITKRAFTEWFDTLDAFRNDLNGSGGSGSGSARKRKSIAAGNGAKAAHRSRVNLPELPVDNSRPPEGATDTLDTNPLHQAESPLIKIETAPSNASTSSTSKKITFETKDSSKGADGKRLSLQSTMSKKSASSGTSQSSSIKGNEAIAQEVVDDLLTIMKEADPSAAAQFGKTAVNERFAAALIKHLTRHEKSAKALSQPSSGAGRASSAGGGTISLLSTVHGEEEVGLLYPFVPNAVLMHMSLDPAAPFTFDAGVMFLDISGFSAINARLAEDGHSAYVLSDIVNAYFQKLITIIHNHGGDVVKFAGDALYAVWMLSTEDDDEQQFSMGYEDAKDNGLSAQSFVATRMCQCSCDLMKNATGTPVADTGLEFNIHLGLAYGQINSRIFDGPPDGNMPHSFPFLSGDALQNSALACNEAKAGEVCIHESAYSLLKDSKIVKTSMYSQKTAKNNQTNLSSSFGASSFRFLEGCADDQIPPRALNPIPVGDSMARQFLPRPIADRITGGIDKFFLAEMRELAVLFVAYAGKTDEEVWFNEVCSTLHQHSCEIVQVLDDDKGTHVVAAFNLYAMGESACDEALRVAAALDRDDSGSYVGIAAGESFCGVIGGADATQWDISGPAVVRACRCMQEAQRIKCGQVIDHSVLKGATDKSNLLKLTAINVKGEHEPVQIFRLRDPRATGTGWELHFTHTLCSAVHREVISNIKNIMTDRGTEGAPTTVILKGPLGSGKFSIFLNSVDGTRFLPLVHVADESQKSTQLGILYTITAWFSQSQVGKIRRSATCVQEALKSQRNNLAFKLGLDLLKIVSLEGKYTALIVRRAQLLDHGSIAFIGCLSKELQRSPKFIALLTCYPLFGFQHPERVLTAFAFSKLFQVECATEADTRALVEHQLKARSNNNLANFVFSKSTGHVESVVELCTYMTKNNYLRMGKDGTMGIVHAKTLRNTPWHDIAERLPGKTIHLLDRLPPHLLTLVKIVCSITRQPGISAFFPSVTAVCRSIMHAKLNVSDVQLLQELCILRLVPHRCTAHSGDVSVLDSTVFYVPPMRDIVQHVQVPQQDIEINYICGAVYGDTHPMSHPLQYLVRARHYLYAKQYKICAEDLRSGWAMLHGLNSSSPTTGSTSPSHSFSHLRIPPQDRAEFRTRFVDTIIEVPDFEEFLQRIVPDEEDRHEIVFTASKIARMKDQRSTSSKPHKQNSRSSLLDAAGGGKRRGSDSSNTSSKFSSSHVGQMPEGSLYNVLRFKCPLELGPAREHFKSLTTTLLQLHEYCETAQAMQVELEVQRQGMLKNPSTAHLLISPNQDSAKPDGFPNTNGFQASMHSTTSDDADLQEIPPFMMAALTRNLTIYIKSLKMIRAAYSISSEWDCHDKLTKLRNELVEAGRGDAETTRNLCATHLQDHISEMIKMGDLSNMVDCGSLGEVDAHTAMEFPAVAQVLELLSRACNIHNTPTVVAAGAPSAFLTKKNTQRPMGSPSTEGPPLIVDTTVPPSPGSSSLVDPSAIVAANSSTNVPIAVTHSMDPKDVAGSALYILFEDLSTILKLTSSTVRQAAFCKGLYELHEASLGLPEKLPDALRQFSSFLKLWINEEIAA